MTEVGLTPSQTVGPYLRDRAPRRPDHEPARRRVGPARDPHLGRPPRRRRRSGPGRHGRDLAGERSRSLRASGGRSRGDPARGRLHRLRALGHRGRRPLRVRHGEARSRSVGGRAAPGAAPPRRRLRARPPEARGDPHVLPRRGERERRGPRAPRARAGGAGDARRARGGRHACASTSSSRATGQTTFFAV